SFATRRRSRSVPRPPLDRHDRSHHISTWPPRAAPRGEGSRQAGAVSRQGGYPWQCTLIDERNQENGEECSGAVRRYWTSAASGCATSGRGSDSSKLGTLRII